MHPAHHLDPHQAEAAGPAWSPSPTEAEYYQSLFQIADISNSGRIAGRDAVNFFQKSGLDFTVLKDIWNIADAKQQHCLEMVTTASYHP